MGTILGSAAFVNENKIYETTTITDSKCFICRIPTQTISRLINSSRTPEFESNLYKTRIETQIPECSNWKSIQNLTENQGFFKNSSIFIFERNKSFFSPSFFFLIKGKLLKKIILNNKSKGYFYENVPNDQTNLLYSSQEELISETDSIKLLSQRPKLSGFYPMEEISRFSSNFPKKPQNVQKKTDNLLTTSLDSNVNPFRLPLNGRSNKK